MTTAASARTLEVRHLQLARAAFAALAAVMVTFTPDHSATVGLAVFSGFAIATALSLGVAAALVFPAGHRWPSIALAAVTLAAGVAASIGTWRSTTSFFVIVIAWAFLAGALEILGALRERASAPRAVTRDGITMGAITVLLAVGLLLVRPDYALDYTLEEAGSFTLTGITIAVGLFGGYAAIVAVFLGIAGFSPRREPVGAEADGSAS